MNFIEQRKSTQTGNLDSSGGILPEPSEVALSHLSRLVPPFAACSVTAVLRKNSDDT